MDAVSGARSVAGKASRRASCCGSSGASFDSDEIIAVAPFGDSAAIDAVALQKFLTRTPYGHASFLATYLSNGVRAVDAIEAAAAKYGLNPLVFIVRAQVDQGLVGELDYPSQAARVEYAFGCGCPGFGDCDPALGGFDLQLDCLGRAVRKDLDDIAARGHTSGGWGPRHASTSLDGIAVTPADASTAVLYTYTPRVGLGVAGGVWVFWNVWQSYATALDYAGPTDTQPPAPSQSIGDSCHQDEDCRAIDGASCDTSYPGGACTAPCTSGCPAATAQAPAVCVAAPNGAICLAGCDPSIAAPYRPQYACRAIAIAGAGDASDAGEMASVCVPE